jgi:hypothetical protein
MTTKTITGTIVGGYTLAAVYSALSVTSSGVITGGRGGAGFAGVSLPRGGEADNSGRIVGGVGAYSLRSPGGAGGAGLSLAAAGAVNNGGEISGGAGGGGTYVEGGVGGAGVSLAAGGEVDNRGSIRGGAGGGSFYGVGGAGGAGVALAAGGSLVNGGAITGGAGGLGSLDGGAGGTGVALAAGGTVDNAGLISGGRGGRARSAHGTSAAGAGVRLDAGGLVTNGAASTAGATITGAVGVQAGTSGAATVINYGAIQGTSGVAVVLGSAADRLVVEAGSTWMGSVEGGGGALELASGAGTLSGLGATGSISGAETMTFSGFGAYDLDAGTQWTLSGADTLSAGATLTIDGEAEIEGDLVSRGAIAGAGRLTIATGATLRSSSTVADALTVSFDGGTGTLALARPGRFGATISGFAASDTIDLTGIAATRATLDARDRLEIFDGATRLARLQLSGNFTGASFAVRADGRGGTDITLAGASPHSMIAAMAGLGVSSAAARLGEARIDIGEPRLLLAKPAVA